MTLDDILDSINTHGSIRAAAKHLGRNESTIRRRVHRASEKGVLGTKPVLPGFVIKKTSTQLGPDGELQREWVQQHKEPGEEFAPPPGHFVKGVSALTDSSGRIIQQWVKTSEDRDQTLNIIRTVADELKQDLPRVKPTPAPRLSNALLLNQYTVTDLHFGMLAWKEETRKDDYDLKIAEKLLLDWFAAAICMSPNSEVGLLAQLGDLMHHDSLESVTPAHRNVLDADSRLQKIIRVVIRVIRRVITMLLEKHPKVHVIMASANHDPASSAWMREWLHAMYEDEPRITVDNSPDFYYAYDWGKTALFYHHGHKRNVVNVDSVFVGKFRELYGRAKHSYGHVGHLHNDAVREGNLMKVERHRTLAPPDAYASSGGWLSEQDAKVITYHREFGEVFRSVLSPEMIRG